jgi:hypothetical protein
MLPVAAATLAGSVRIEVKLGPPDFGSEGPEAARKQPVCPLAVDAPRRRGWLGLMPAVALMTDCSLSPGFTNPPTPLS